MRVCPVCAYRTEHPFCPEDGSATVQEEAAGPSGAPAEGELFEGRYRLHELLGEGGFGSVYRATQLSVDRIVAVKILKAELSSDAQVSARFQQEARTIAGLNHPGIIDLYDFGRTGSGQLFLVMEYLVGEALDEVIAREAPLPEPRVARLAIEALEALAEAHAAGIVHRDLKPENLFIAREGRRGDVLKILDFGIAKILDERPDQVSLTGKGMTVGSPRYMSPEQCRAEPVSGKSDLYSLGLVLYEALCGRPVFEKPTLMDYMMAHVRETPAPPSVDGRVLRGPHVDVIMRCLAKDPADRPASAEAAVQAMRRAMADLTTVPGETVAIDVHAATAPAGTAAVGADAAASDGAATMALDLRLPPRAAAPPVSGGGDEAATIALDVRAAGIAAPPEPREAAPTLWTEVPAPAPTAERKAAGAAEALRAGLAHTDASAPAPRPAAPARAGSGTRVEGAVGVSPESVSPETETRAMEALAAPSAGWSDEVEAAFPSRRPRWVAGGVAALLLVAGLLVWVLWPGGEAPPEAPAAEAPARTTAPVARDGAPARADDEGEADDDEAAAAEAAVAAAPEPAAAPEKLRVRVASVPARALVLRDGVALGVTPLVVSWAAGDAPPTVEIREAGHRPAVVALTAADAGGERSVTLERVVAEAPEPRRAPKAAATAAPEPADERAPVKFEMVDHERVDFEMVE